MLQQAQQRWISFYTIGIENDVLVQIPIYAWWGEVKGKHEKLTQTLWQAAQEHNAILVMVDKRNFPNEGGYHGWHITDAGFINCVGSFGAEAAIRAIREKGLDKNAFNSK